MKNSIPNAGVQELESPFLHLNSFKQKQFTASTSQKPMPVQSPFKSVFELEGQEQSYNEEQEAYVELMDELYDEEFDGFLQEIALEAKELYENQLSGSYNNLQNHETMIRQSLNEHYNPLLNEVQKFMHYMEEVADRQGAENMTDNEWENLVDQYVPQMQLSPGFENFGGWFKKIAKKVGKGIKAAKKIVKKGVGIAKKFGLGFIVKRLNKYMFKFLKGFLIKGINKLPSKYRPLAKKLARKIGILKEVSDDEQEIGFQQELDGMLAEFLITDNEMDLDMIEQEFMNETDMLVEDPLQQLDAARENFINQISELNEGDDPEAAIEQFVPAVLTGLKWGIKIVGKERVKKIITGLIAKLIQKYIGKKYALMLSKHLVGAGFKLLNLQISPEQQIEEGNRAIATVVEDTIRQVANLPEHILQNEALLGSNVVQAFEESAKANFPDILTEETYVKRPDLRESSNHKVAWKMKTIDKLGRRKKCRYKKLNKEMETELTPYLADEIKTFDGMSLGNILRDQMGVVVNRNIPVKVHLYETLPGASRFQIGKNEPLISRGNPINSGFRQIHPLTSVAAGLLLGEPALGCKSKSNCLGGHSNQLAHRYYYLEIPGARPQIYSAPTGIQSLRKATGLKVKINFIKNQVHLFLFLGESDAQEIAALMRQNMENNAAKMAMTIFNKGLKIAFSKHTTDNCLIVHPNVLPGKTSGRAMGLVPQLIQDKLKVKIADWVAPKLSEYLMLQKHEFIQNADAEVDGLTVCVTMEAPSHLNLIGQLISFNKVQIPTNIFAETSVDLIINVKPGYHYA